eukprot:CAMPEP_0174356932 /NCGR_PEP_ID=MMETSP0811_2-20130205/32938_1 /TAXON_ID=73025 ORGANISM="Eutreptiella gymnastica-like, Strain CCMP1594" /NCGR_SAMPLE_ID=MMETSP0811_2 /ASSEMBLY_ACC=CAM_ASM_000667 /LENGTH=97 /DNA_ID=CAMNT_0015489291 /DNA_START=266 /DNA_END=559 /DNA_ORIENTATION=-
MTSRLGLVRGLSVQLAHAAAAPLLAVLPRVKGLSSSAAGACAYSTRGQVRAHIVMASPWAPIGAGLERDGNRRVPKQNAGTGRWRVQDCGHQLHHNV